MPSAADDPVRADVERWLRALVTAGLAVPGAAVSGIRRCLGSRLGPVTDRVAEPMRLVRSIVELAVGAPPAAGAASGRTEAPPAESVDADHGAGSVAADDLPIDQYESLAASHVVDRLGSLTPAELRRVRRFEVAHRGRRTVIGRIDQLLGDATPT